MVWQALRTRSWSFLLSTYFSFIATYSYAFDFRI